MKAISTDRDQSATDTPDDYLGYTVAQLATVLEARIEHALQRALGISVRHFGILAHLQRHPGIGSGALARLVLITPQSIGGILQTMFRKGLIERQGPDRRGAALALGPTPAGTEILAAAYKIATALRAEEAALLAPGEAEAANAILARLLAALTGRAEA